MQNKVLRIIIIVMLVSVVLAQLPIQNHTIKNPSIINACINKLSYCNDYFQTWLIRMDYFLSYFTMHFQ
ncbi:hypothetical protein EU75_03395 [Staphylococcus aureus]|nr:hypothetical protein EU75_03395 [Staphylococcus aureus]